MRNDLPGPHTARALVGCGSWLAAAALGLTACDHGARAAGVRAPSESGALEPARPPRAIGQGGWEELEPGREAPPAGEDTAAAYDGARHRVLAYGGKDDRDVVLNELWAFDLGARRWSQILPQGALPPAREDHSLVLDEGNDCLVLFGGENGSTVNDTWIFDLGAERWSEITDASAPALEGHVAIYDPVGRRMLVFGGLREDKAHKDDKVLSDETWALDLDRTGGRYGKWAVLATGEVRPCARREHRGAYDPLRRRMLVFGGRRRTKTGFLDDVWSLDLASLAWHEIETHGERPDPIRQTALGYDPEANLLTVFGGEVRVERHGDGDEEFLVDQVWVLDLAAGQWSNRTPHPRPMYDHLGVFVPEYGGTLIYGGSSGWPGKEHGTWLLRVR